MENPVKMKRRKMTFFRHFIEAQIFIKIATDKFYRFVNSTNVFVLGIFSVHTHILRDYLDLDVAKLFIHVLST